MPAPVLATVLNVNDNAASQYLASLTLRAAGYHVVEAGTGLEALQRAESLRPDLIVLDIKLPDMSGYEVCERLRANPLTAGIAVIQTSATFITAEKKVRGLKSGADVYLTQPFDPEELIATVNSVLRVRLLEQEARRRAQQLEEADRRKDEFLAMLAHELRNPLAAITTATELVKRDPSGPKAPRMVELIQRQTRHLTRMVDDLLEVSRITRGKVELRRARVDLRAVLEQVFTVIRPTAQTRGVSLLPLPELPAPLWLDGDAARLEQVFTNLLDNATKYTDSGGQAALSVTEQDGWVEVAVKDNGIGISAELLSQVFEPFIQADNSLERKRGGLGIGLMLVHRLVELHSGQVSAASPGVGQGSEFTVRLPLLAQAGAQAAAEPAAESPSELSPAVESQPRRILVVEDNADARLTLHEMLESWGHQVEVAQDGLEGVTKALQRRVELAVVDIGLPGLDGYAVAERLRAQLGQTIRLVALSGYGAPEARQRALRAGFDVHLTKPVSPHELARVLATLGVPVVQGAGRSVA